MNTYLSESEKYNIPVDLVEETKIDDNTSVVYAGIFDKNKNENSEDGCIIKKITTVIGALSTITKIEYAEGNNQIFKHKWNERESYNYRYSDK